MNFLELKQRVLRLIHDNPGRERIIVGLERPDWDAIVAELNLTRMPDVLTFDDERVSVRPYEIIIVSGRLLAASTDAIER